MLGKRHSSSAHTEWNWVWNLSSFPHPLKWNICLHSAILLPALLGWELMRTAWIRECCPEFTSLSFSPSWVSTAAATPNPNTFPVLTLLLHLLLSLSLLSPLLSEDPRQAEKSSHVSLTGSCGRTELSASQPRYVCSGAIPFTASAQASYHGLLPHRDQDYNSQDSYRSPTAEEGKTNARQAENRILCWSFNP